MFQDIDVNFSIDYDNKGISGDDFILSYDGNKILCRIDSHGLSFPKFSDLSLDFGQNFVFGFLVGSNRFFIASEGIISVDDFDYVNINMLKTLNNSVSQFAGVTGYHYNSFHLENKFCGKCGTKLNHNALKRCMLCPNCGNEVFPKIAPAVIVGIIDEQTDSILMTRYADRDYKKLALVAGFAEMGESAEQTAMREAMEETGLNITDLTYYSSQPWGFAQNLLFGYFAKVTGSRKITLDRHELSEGLWVPRKDVIAQPNSISLTGEMIWAFKNRIV